MKISHFFLILVLSIFMGCVKQKTEPMVHFRVTFSTTQERLNNIAQPTDVPTGHAAQSPLMNALGLHYLELAPTATTALGKGQIVMTSPETTQGGSKAITFSSIEKAKDSAIIVSIPLKNLAIGKYEWVRASVAYQNYDIFFNLMNVPIVGNLPNERGTLASFVGFNNYITTYKVFSIDDVVQANRKQGYWAFETKLNAPYNTYNKVSNGQSPEGSTTVVNPLAQTSPIPAGSCVVTGKFETPLSITGTETEDVTVWLSFSINKSFEWEETINRNGKWDIDVQNSAIERVTDMGLRGLKVRVSK